MQEKENQNKKIVVFLGMMIIVFTGLYFIYDTINTIKIDPNKMSYLECLEYKLNLSGEYKELNGVFVGYIFQPVPGVTLTAINLPESYPIIAYRPGVNRERCLKIGEVLNESQVIEAFNLSDNELFLFVIEKEKITEFFPYELPDAIKEVKS